MRKTLSFTAAFFLVFGLLLCAVVTPALSPARFEKAVLNTVNREAVGMSESDLTAFARDTMSYLRGTKAEWEPQTPFPVPPSFRDHMAEVRGWVKTVPYLLIFCLLLMASALYTGLSRRWFRAGLAAALGLIAAVLVWAAADFDSLWMMIHRVLIPGGIFPAGERIMQLFPLGLFFSYVAPVLCWLAVYAAAVLGGGVLWRRLSLRKNAGNPSSLQESKLRNKG